MNSEIEEPKPGETYRHFKNKANLYRIMAIARDVDNPEKKSVIYTSLYESVFPAGTVWSRSLDDFVGFKKLNGESVKRFTRVK